MIYEQFLRWEDFAIRMAEHCFPHATEARRNKILYQVKDYFHWRRYQNDWPDIMDWDGNNDDYFLGDQVDDFFEEYLHYNPRNGCCTGKFHNQITCCIRAGFDMAVKQSGGVLGFTAGDVRRMWDGEVPDWVKEDWVSPFDLIPDGDGVCL